MVNSMLNKRVLQQTLWEKQCQKNLDEFFTNFPNDPIKAVRALMPSLIERIPEEKKVELWKIVKTKKILSEYLDVLLPSSASDLIPKDVLCSQNFFDLVYQAFPKHLDIFLKVQCFKLKPLLKANYSRIKEKLPETAKLLQKKGYC